MSAIDYDVIQNRLDYLDDQNWFNPNGFYPTVMCFSLSADHQKLQADLFKKISYDNQTPGKEENETLISTSQKNMVTTNVSLNKLVTGNDDGTITKVTTEACEHNISQGNAGTGSKLGNLSEKGLSYIVGVEGLEFPKMPFKKVNGMLASEKRVESEGQEIKIKFLAKDTLEVMSFLGRWESEWWIYNGAKKILRSKFTNSHYGEGYLGLEYVHIYPNGSVQRLGHVFIGGLVPLQINVDGMNSLGPMVSGKSEIPTITVTCLYSQAVLGMAKDPTKAEDTRWYFFK